MIDATPATMIIRPDDFGLILAACVLGFVALVAFSVYLGMNDPNDRGEV